MVPTQDRRATPRFQAKPGNQIVYGVNFAEVRDLSLSGAFVYDPDPLPVGSELAFTLQASGVDIALEGVVRHWVSQEGMGIEFTNVSSVSKRRLTIHLASLVAALERRVKA